MAWQLIYTSAPRSLEAGRSGFGTVARHRAISPLLVSAIERASQFSRLPGTDAGRVIYSHRIVAVAGGRFHVLSAIRDAGADYTGRTNHIAHHLIVDPREIAQLGPDGPSPADVLLAMRWAASWNEPPRFLEASDEVALSTIHPHTNGSAWEQIAGNANQAWLLATGDASRGAYIIQPGSADLREVYSESLRLIPDRLWQISFTTSLQPSDEPGDFRWIGIEERSPLRAQSESSGRPVLNLALPDTLPLVETVQRPAVSQIRQNSEPASTPVWNDLPTASTETSPAVPGSHSSPTRHRTAARSGASHAGESRIQSKWWLLGGALAIGAMITAFFVGRIFIKSQVTSDKPRAETKSVDESSTTKKPGVIQNANTSDISTAPAKSNNVTSDRKESPKEQAPKLTLPQKYIESKPAAPTVSKPIQNPEPVPSQVPLYFVKSLDALSKTPVPELESDATYYLVEIPRNTGLLTPPPFTDVNKLYEDPSYEKGSSHTGKLRVNAHSKDVAFILKEKVISCEAGSKGIALPFVLIAKRKTNNSEIAKELVWVFITGQIEQPLFKKKTGKITPHDDVLKLDYAALGLPGIPKNSTLKLALPRDWAHPSNNKPKVQYIEESFSLVPLKAELDADRKRVTADIATREASLKEILSFSRDAEFGKLHGEFMKASNLSQKIQDEKKRRKEEADKRKGKPAEIPEEEYLLSNIPVERQYGGCMAAYSVANGVMQAYFVHADDMLSAGIELFRSKDKSNFEKQIKTAQGATGKAIANLGKKEDKEKYLNNLNKFQEMALVLLDSEKPQREAKQAKINAELTALRAKLAETDSHPLITGKVPSDIYQLQAVVDGLDVPLMDIEVSSP